MVSVEYLYVMYGVLLEKWCFNVNWIIYVCVFEINLIFLLFLVYMYVFVVKILLIVYVVVVML